MTIIIIFITLAGVAGATQGPQRLGQLIKATHTCQLELGVHPTPAHARAWRGDRYDRWRLQLWRARRDAWCEIAQQAKQDVQLAARIAFGRYADQALAVATCESRRRTTARNGQYLGVWQMGSDERARYGHGDTAIAQARAAARYFVDSGKDWSPWQCQPSGGLAW